MGIEAKPGQEVRVGSVVIDGAYSWSDRLPMATLQDGMIFNGARARLVRAGQVVEEDLRITSLARLDRFGLVDNIEAAGTRCVFSSGAEEFDRGDVVELYVLWSGGLRVDQDDITRPARRLTGERVLSTVLVWDVRNCDGLNIVRAKTPGRTVGDGTLNRARARVLRNGAVIAEGLRVHFHSRGVRVDLRHRLLYSTVPARKAKNNLLLLNIGFSWLRRHDEIVIYTIADPPREERISHLRITAVNGAAGAGGLEVCVDGRVDRRHSRLRVRLIRGRVVMADGLRLHQIGATASVRARIDHEDVRVGDVLEVYRLASDEPLGTPSTLLRPGESGGAGSPIPRPVLDPDLPGAVRKVLSERPAALIPADGSAADPQKRSILRVAGAAAVLGLITVQVAEAAQDQPGIATRLLATMLVLMIALVAVLLLDRPKREVRYARRAHGRYLRPTDLDEESRTLLVRAQAAITAVRDSAADQAGLLDDIRNAVTLPHQEWEIAQTLRSLTELRAANDAAHNDQVTPLIQEILDERDEALALSRESLLLRITALEEYAARTRAVDAAHAELETIHRLLRQNDDYQQLLAQTVRDQLGAAEIAGLTERADEIEKALRRSIEQARQAGLAIAGHPL